ncbi:hypothetical protein HOI83_02495 [Candidatus Uhrbacteria bacterium]|jgi:hypothetical protein|nr:hypothetical protein [Candidatus Uhrbacteria bacterium]
MKKEVTTEDLLAFMQEHMVTKNDLDVRLAKAKHEILDVMDRKFADTDQNMNQRFKAVDNRFDELDFRFDTLADILEEKNVISSVEATHLRSLKPVVIK